MNVHGNEIVVHKIKSFIQNLSWEESWEELKECGGGQKRVEEGGEADQREERRVVKDAERGEEY